MDSDHIFHAGWFFDGAGNPAEKDIIFGVKKGKIIFVEHLSQAPAMGQVTDLSDCTVIPGLIDCHAHLAISGINNLDIRKNQLFAPYEKAAPVIKKHLEDNLTSGVIAVRDGGDWGGHALKYTRNHNLRIIVKCAGRAWRASGRYGKLVGRTPKKGQTLAQAIAQNNDTPDHIKIIGSGLNSLVEFKKQTSPQFSQKDLAKAVNAAQEKNLPVMIHANGVIAVREAIESGCSSIEHGFFMGRKNLELMAKTGIIWVPTAVTMDSYAKILSKKDPKADVAAKNLDHQLGQLSEAHKLGVNVAVGTDAGSPGVYHGFSVRREMELFLRAGFNLERAIKAATSTGARVLGMKNAGILAPKMDATFIVIHGPPKNLIKNLEKPAHIVIKGVNAYQL